MTDLRSFSRGPLLLGSLTALLCSSAACSNDQPQRIYVIPSDADMQVNQLEDTELQTICDSYANYVEAEISFDTVSRALCLVSAQLASFDAETCQAVYETCIEGAPEPLSIRAEIENDAACTGALRNCDATVAQLEGCLNVQLDTVLDILDSLACAGSSAQSRQTANDLMGGVSACANLNEQCTEFAEPVTLQ